MQLWSKKFYHNSDKLSRGVKWGASRKLLYYTQCPPKKQGKKLPRSPGAALVFLLPAQTDPHQGVAADWEPVWIGNL